MQPFIYAAYPAAFPGRDSDEQSSIAAVCGLAPDGVCLASCSYLLERWALTPPFHLYPSPGLGPEWGQFVFCDTIRCPDISPGYPRLIHFRGILLYGVRTFLPDCSGRLLSSLLCNFVFRRMPRRTRCVSTLFSLFFELTVYCHICQFICVFILRALNIKNRIRLI